jgi:large subunit ribosomal protein L16
MAMMPKRVKFRKQQRGKMRGVATRGNYVAFGDFGLQCLGLGWLSARQIEAGRVAATHFLQREGKIFVRVFPDMPYTKKPLETRMGKGKAEPEYWVACIRPGNVIFEVGGVEEEIAREALSRVAHKIPQKCRFVKRRHGL